MRHELDKLSRGCCCTEQKVNTIRLRILYHFAVKDVAELSIVSLTDARQCKQNHLRATVDREPFRP